MENSQINGETPVLEESVENDSVDTAASVPVVDEGQSELESGSESDSDVVVDSEESFNGSDGVEHSVTESDPAEDSEESGDDVEVVEVVTTALPSEPIAVYLVEEPEESSDIESYAVTGSPYLGTISSTYLDYFEGIAEKLGFNEHYVLFRQSQYEYTMFWGEDLELSGNVFSGSGLSYCSIYVGNYNTDRMVSWGTDSVELSAGAGYVYSDLGEYPSLTKGGTGFETLAILFALAFGVVYNVCHDIFDYIMERIYRK